MSRLIKSARFSVEKAKLHRLRSRRSIDGRLSFQAVGSIESSNDIWYKAINKFREKDPVKQESYRLSEKYSK